MRTEKQFLDEITSVVPSERQLMWQELEFTSFIHYGMNTFTNNEWGQGTEDINIFNPKSLDTDQWCESILKAGIKACIFTCKHHDGLCLWDTKFTEHNVMNTPYKQDILHKLSKSCEKYGIKLGVYLSPWDRHEATYGQGKPYDDYFCNQLTELLTNYGELYTVWFDGACGEGPNGKKQEYDWKRYYELIRRLQPQAVISVSGPDVRWCGNEAGDCRASEWSVVPRQLFSNKAIAEASQQTDNEEFRLRKLGEMDQDLGSRELLKQAESYIWYPAEVDTSIRPGWFYHEEEDDKVRPLEELFDIYVNAVGGNSVLLLNIPPHKDGYITKYDVERLTQLGEKIKESFSDDLSGKAMVDANFKFHSCEKDKCCENIDYDWHEINGTTCPEITFTFDTPQKLQYIVIKEEIRHSQRVEEFIVEIEEEGTYKVVVEGTTVGYKKICRLSDVTTQKVRIRFTGYRKNVVIDSIRIYG